MMKMMILAPISTAMLAGTSWLTGRTRRMTDPAVYDLFFHGPLFR
jgi:hypothetical protein